MKIFLSSVKGKIIIALLGVLVIAAAVVILLLLNSAEAGYRNISISEIYGSVIAQNSGKEYKAYKNMRLSDGYALTTDFDSYTRMLLDDDKYVKLEQQSRVLFENIGSDNSRRTSLRLERGALVTEITKPLAQNEDYVINTPNAVLAVRGTYFRVEVTEDSNGDEFTYVYTYGGAVACRRVFPDGTIADEDVVINSGYKACIKMDEIITVYIEEALDEITDNVDPIEFYMISDDELVDIYNSSMNGHELFDSSRDFWDEIQRRNIDISDYKSVYDGGDIPPYEENSDSSDDNNDSESSEDSLPSESDNESSSDENSEYNSDNNSDNNSGSTDGENSGVTDGENSGSTDGENSGSTDGENSGSTDGENSGSTDEGNSGSTDEGNSGGNSGNGGGSDSGHNHVFGRYVSDNNATCTFDGTKTAVCEICGERNTVVDENSKLSHTPNTVTVPSTCTEKGSVTVTCAVCKTVLSTEELKLTAHTPNTVTVPSTCTEKGSVTVTCAVCKTVLSTEELELIAHSWTETVKPAECETAGLITTFCEVCKEVKSEEEIPALGHTEVEEITKPTGFSEGRRVVYCSVCKKLLEEEILPKFDGTLYMENGSVIITATGYKQGVYDELKNAEEIPYEGAYTLTQKDSTAAISRYVDIYGNVPITLDGINIRSITLYNDVTLYGTEKASYLSQIVSGRSFSLSLTLEEIYLNVCESALEQSVIIDVDVITLESGELNIVDKEHTGSVLTASVLNINGGVLYADAVAADFGIAANQINISGGIFKFQESSKWWAIKYSVLNMTGGRVYAVESEAVSPWFCGIYTYPTINISGGFLWITAEEFCCLNITGGCVVFDEDYYTDKITDGNGKDYYCTVYDQYPGEITVELADGTGYVYGLAVEDAAEDGKYYVWLPIKPEEPEEPEVPDGIAINGENFPDPVFREYVSVNFDIDNNEYLSDEELGNATEIIVEDCGITSLNGIEFFTALTHLDCDKNSGLATLDVSNNTALTILECSQTQITYLDLSQNVALTQLWCRAGSLPYIDISNNTLITFFYAASNTYPLPKDITTSFDISIDPNFKDFAPNRVSNLKNAEIDENSGNFFNITGDISYTYDCGQGYSANFTLKLISEPVIPEDPDGIAINGENFPDPVFRDYISGNFDINEDGYLSDSEIEQVTTIDVSGTSYSKDGEITSLKGIEFFKNLKKLFCYYNSKLESLDVSENTKLEYLHCEHTSISSLDVSNNTVLVSLSCSETLITSLNVSNNTALESLSCGNTKITELDVNQNTALTNLYFENTQITALDISQNIALEYLMCYDTQIEELDTSRNAVLRFLSCYNTQISSLDTSKNPALETLLCHKTQITSIDTSLNAYLVYLDCSNTQITSLNVVNNTQLSTLYCYNTGITELDVSNNPMLTELRCNNTQINSLNLTGSTELTSLDCSNTHITYLDLRNNTSLASVYVTGCKLAFIDVSGCAGINILSAIGNIHPIPSNSSIFDASGLSGFDPSKVSQVEGAEFDEVYGIFHDIVGETATYYYDCGYGSPVQFTLERSGEPEEFDGTLYMEDGSVIITATGYKQGVYEELEEVDEIPYTGAYIISQRNSSVALEHYIDIYADIPITLDGINIHSITICSNIDVTLLGTEKDNYLSQIFEGPRVDASLALSDINLNVGESAIEYSVKISIKTLTLESGTLTVIDKDSVRVIDVDVLNINGGKLYVDATSRDYGVVADEINVSGGIFAIEYTQWWEWKYVTMNISGGRVYGYENGVPIPIFTGYGETPVINISGGFLWGVTDAYSVSDLFITGGCVAFGEKYYTQNIKSGQNTEYYCTVYDTYPGNITVNLADGTSYIYKLSPEDAAEDGKYYVWLPVPPEVPDGIEINSDNFPDPVFYDYIMDFDLDSNGYLSAEEIEEVTEIAIYYETGLTTLKGIEHFKNLRSLIFPLSGVTEIDVSQNTALEKLSFSGSKIAELNLENNTALTVLECDNSALTSLDLSKCTKLTVLNCSYNLGLTELDVTPCTKLTSLKCSNTFIESIDVTRCEDLVVLDCSNAPITVLDVSENPLLTELNCSFTQITVLDVSYNPELTSLSCSSCHLPFVDIANNPLITTFSAASNTYQLPVGTTTSFDTRNDPNFTGFDPAKVINPRNADFNQATGVFSNITGDITYTYNCGQGKSVLITLTLS